MALYSFQRIPSPPQSPNSQLSPASRELRLMFLEGDELRNQWAEQASTLDTERSAAIRREAKLKDILRTSDAHGNLSLLAIAQVPANELHAIPHASDEELGLKVAWPDAFEHAQTIDALSLVTPALDAPSSTLTKATTQVVRQQVAASSMVPLSAAGDDMTVRSTTATRVDASSTKPTSALSATRFEARDTDSPPIKPTTAHSARSVRQSSPAATARMAVTVPQPKAGARIKSEHRSPPLPAKTIVELARRPPPTTERAGSLGIHLVERVSQAETGALPSPPQQDATQMVNQPHNSANAPSSRVSTPLRVSTQQPPSVFMQMPSASSPPPRHSPVGQRNQPHADVVDLSIGVMQASDSSLTPIVSLALQGAGPLTRAGQSNRQPQMPSTFVTSNGKKYVVVPVTSGGNSNSYDTSGSYPSATHKFAAHEHGEFAYAAPTPDFAADQLAAGPIASTGSGSSVFPQLPPRTSGPSPALLAMAGGRPETAFMPPTTGSDGFKSRKKKKRAADKGKAIGSGVPIASNSNNGAFDEDRALILLSEPLKPFVPHTIHDPAAVNVPLPPRPGTSLPSGPKVWIRELTPEHTTGQAFVPQLFQDHARRANANANASWLASSNEDMRSVSEVPPRRQQSYERSFDTHAHAKPPTSDSVLASASSSAPTAREPQEIQSETKPPPKQVAEPQGAPISRPDLKSRAGSQVPGSCRGRSSVVRDAPPMVNGIPMHSLPKNAESARAASVEAASRASSLEPSMRADRKRSRSRSTSVVRTSNQLTTSRPSANPFTDDELPKKRPRLSPVAEDEPMETGADPRLAKANATIAADSKQGDQSVLPEIAGDDDEEERIVYDVRGFAPLGASRHNVSSEFSAPNGQHRQHSVEEIAPSPAERLHTRMAIPLEDRISDGPITIMPSSSRSRSRATSPAVRRSPVSQGPRKLPLDQRITSPDAPHLSPRARSPQQHTSQSFSRGRSPSPRSAWPPRDRPRSRSPRRRQWSSRSRSRSRDSFYSPGQRRGSSWDRGRRSSMSRENNYRPSYNSRSRSRSRSPVRRAASPYRRPYSSRSRSRGWSPPLRRGEYGRERSRSRSMSRSRTADYRPQPPRARGRGRGRGRGGPLRGR